MINGVTDKKKITLRASYPGNQSLSSSGIHIVKYSALEMLIGWHFEKESDICFDQLIEETTQLAAWCCCTGFTIENNFNAKPWSTTIKYIVPEPIDLAKIPPYKLGIVFLAIIPGLKFGQKEASIREIPYLQVKADNPIPLRDLLNVLAKIKFLLTLLVGKPVRHLALKGTSQKIKEELSGKIFPVDIDIVHVNKIEEKDKHDVIPPFQIVTLPEIKSNISDLVERFFMKYEEIVAPLELFIVTKSRKMFSPEQYFLNMAQVMESFHRRTVGGVDIPHDQHKERIGAVLSSCPEQHRTWLKDRLLYSNELSLRLRIKDIWGSLPALTPHLHYKRKEFIDRIIDTRNYLTHYSKDLQTRAAIKTDLFSLGETMRILFEAYILKWLRVPPEVVDNKYMEILKRTTRETISLDS